jgi:hypothetical protein
VFFPELKAHVPIRLSRMGPTVDGNGFAIVAFLDRPRLILVKQKHDSTGTPSKGVDVVFNVTITRKRNFPSINVDIPWTPAERRSSSDTLGKGYFALWLAVSSVGFLFI